MSNIQITENASGKYSPEWFYSESQTPEWISFAHKADELRENFINLFGIERLKSLSGKDLLTSLFYNDEGTKTNLCYILEMDKDIREVFGSISGGAAYKFGLFYHKKNQSWTCGSPLKPVLLTEAEAIQKADEMRNDLVEGAEIISSFGPLDSEEDYEQLYKQLEHIPGINMVWRMKYYQMLFPALFAPFYGQDIQLRVLHFLNQKSFLFYFETEHVFFANTFFETQKKTRNFLLIFSCFYILFFFFLILFFPKTLLRNTKNPLLSSYISNIYSSLTSTSFFAIKIYQYDTPILNNLTPFKPVIIPIVMLLFTICPLFYRITCHILSSFI